MIAVIIHEYGHGRVAKYWGDTTAEDQGRLTLNPVPHVDPIGTLLFPLINMLAATPFLIGWARPVPINPRRFRKYRPGLFWVALAGPSSNILLAWISAALFCAIQLWVPKDFYLRDPLETMAYLSISLNYALAIFNLLPIRPLDGSKMIESVLPTEQSIQFEKLSQYSFFILMGLLLTGALSVLSYPIQLASQLTLYAMAVLFQLPGLAPLS